MQKLVIDKVLYFLTSLCLTSKTSASRNTVGSYVCSCAEGYRLMEDSSSCEPISSVRASLIFTN
ncbi:jg302, partial [Pararge aegeria aegeria]